MSNLPQAYPDSLDGLALILCNAVRKLVRVKGDYDLSRDPVMRVKPVISFSKRMRVDGMEKFNARTVFSSVQFYTDVASMDLDKPLGVLVIFVEADELSRLMWSFDYPRLDEDDDEVILDACGTLTNLIAGYFVKAVHDLSSVHLEMSHFESYINTAVNGVAFASDETQKYEIDFWIKGAKRIVAELSMGPVLPAR